MSELALNTLKVSKTTQIPLMWVKIPNFRKIPTSQVTPICCTPWWEYNLIRVTSIMLTLFHILFYGDCGSTPPSSQLQKHPDPREDNPIICIPKTEKILRRLQSREILLYTPIFVFYCIVIKQNIKTILFLNLYCLRFSLSCIFKKQYEIFF